jgi:hypothetical protein
MPLLGSAPADKNRAGHKVCQRTPVAINLRVLHSTPWEQFSEERYDASRTSNSIFTSFFTLTPALPGGLIPKSVSFTMDSPV